MNQGNSDSGRINASPTKEFFIYMLTRDIPLSRAVLDLVDNSVDGAKHLRSATNYQGLAVRIDLNATHFQISDNCGGIPVDVARDYAFRFGRPKDMTATPGSVGQFGVGMKRAFFKLGRRFVVRSVTTSSRFVVDVQVDTWKLLEGPEGADDWHFDFKEVSEGLSDISADEIGTVIEITDLYESVSESFRLDSFVSRLQQEMRLAHSLSLNKGLAITVKGVPLQHETQELFASDVLKPAYRYEYIPREKIAEGEGPGINVKLYAGVARREIADGGWYIFCNGRLVVRADQTATTVWGNPHDMRQYHPDLAFFRGYVYFDSDDSSLLPWTTTKTGVDIDSPVYRAVQQIMIEMTRPVIAFLANMAKERSEFDSGDATGSALENAYKESKPVQVYDLQVSKFIAPSPVTTRSGPRLQKIQFSRPFDLVEKAKGLLKVSSYRAVGERTFDYYMENEGSD
jgi:hypothetical protein